MIFAHAKHHARLCLAACALLALVSCGGGGGDSGVNTPTPGSTTTTLAGAQELVNTFAATLTGAEETPATASAAQGAGTIVVNPGTRVATATLSTSGISATSALIQEGAPGATGPIVFTLAETAPGSGIWSSKFTLTDAQFTSLQGGNFYFNVRSLSFPNGEIRGQILSQQAVAANSPTGTFSTNAAGSGLNAAATTPATFIAALRGAQETPPNSSAGQGSGAVLTDPARRSLLVAVTTSGIVGTAAQIQSGAPGTAGPIIVPLVETPAGSGVWIANATLSSDQYGVLTSGGLYLNVRSTAFPEGEIRGQILPVQQSVSALTGIGSPGSSTTPITTGTGLTGAGLTDTGLTGNGLTGTGLTGTGLTGTGLTGTGLTGTGLTGTGLTGTGLTGTGLTGTGLTGTGLTGTGLTGTGLTGTGTGLTGTGAFGTTGTTGTTGTIGPSMTGTSTIGSGLSGTGF